ncbi:hypothetical protein [Streptomyces sp. AHA2]|uniref:hypothetical protein n=1 Tax=Streptomyces sp. AHA2 TaxID=3064526 RepID=UPI002FE0B027
MRNKIILPMSSVASAAVAFGIGALVFTNPNTPADASPVPQPTKTVTAPPVAGQAPTQTAQEDAQREAAGTEPGSLPTAPQKASKPPADAPTTSTRTTAPETAKPAEQSPGSEGPFTDAQDDGKVLDDIGKTIMPGFPISVPEVFLPFPGHGEGLPADDVTLVVDGDPGYADPGVVCDAEMAEALGVPLGDCAAEPSKVDTWHPVTD